MELTKQTQGCTAVVCRWMAWLLTLCVLMLACLLSAHPVFAQEKERKLKTGPQPEYPELARKLNIKGSARVRFTITKDGRVKDVKEVGGNPVLLSALVEAVKRWRYEPASTDSEAEVKFDFQ